MNKCVFILLIASALLPIMANTANAVSCFDALRRIIPCQAYLVSGGSSKPSTGCCQGVEDLATIANKSKSERQPPCECLKPAAQNFPINEGNAEAMPNKPCQSEHTITPNIDCSKV